MADIVTKEQRSKNMAAIKSKNTKPEVFICKLLFSEGYRYRKNVKYVPGHPDIFLRKYNAAVFVHGCFWHRHVGCKIAYTPKSNLEFWDRKFETNVDRDKKVKTELIEHGYRQLVIWECTVRQMKKDNEFRDMILSRIKDFLNCDTQYHEL